MSRIVLYPVPWAATSVAGVDCGRYAADMNANFLSIQQSVNGVIAGAASIPIRKVGNVIRDAFIDFRVDTSAFNSVLKRINRVLPPRRTIRLVPVHAWEQR